MALHGEIRVNGMTIGAFEITRAPKVDDDYSAAADSVLTYACMVRQDSTLQGNPAVLERFETEHRYGDGALALVARALTEAQRRAKPEL